MARHLFPFSTPGDKIPERDDRYDYVPPTYATNMERVWHDVAVAAQATVRRVSELMGKYRDLAEEGDSGDRYPAETIADAIEAALALPDDEPKIEGSPS